MREGVILEEALPFVRELVSLFEKDALGSLAGLFWEVQEMKASMGRTQK